MYTIGPSRIPPVSRFRSQLGKSYPGVPVFAGFGCPLLRVYMPSVSRLLILVRVAKSFNGYPVALQVISA